MMKLKGAAVLLQWFLIPALVVTVGVTLMGLINITTTRAKNPAEFLEDLRPGNSATRRWQGAYVLSVAVASKQRDESSPCTSDRPSRCSYGSSIASELTASRSR